MSETNQIATKAAKRQVAPEADVVVHEVRQGCLQFHIVGDSALICNRMSEKAKRELLLPKGRKNAADKASTLKHDPLQEFRDSPYTSRDPQAVTRIQLLPEMFKCAMRTAALDMPGASKAQIGRLLYVKERRVDVYGVPQLMMSVTRCKDINRTPDVRTRMVLPRWACSITVLFVTPIVLGQSVTNLLAAGGITSGIGDWRVEKGSGAFGRYRITAEDDPEYLEIVQTGGREAQDAAIAEPACYDDETESLLAWYQIEVAKRGVDHPAVDGKRRPPKAPRATNGAQRDMDQFA